MEGCLSNMGGIFGGGGGGGSKGPSKAEQDAVAARERKAREQENAQKRSIASRRNAQSKGGNNLLFMTDRENPATGVEAPERGLGAGRNPRDMNEALKQLAAQRKKRNLGAGSSN